MRSLSYAGQTFVTSDTVAEVVLDFAAAAAEDRVGEVVEIPTVTPDGRIELVKFVIGPSSELLSQPSDAPEVMLETDELVAGLRSRMSRFSVSHHVEVGGPIDIADVDEGPVE